MLQTMCPFLSYCSQGSELEEDTCCSSGNLQSNNAGSKQFKLKNEKCTFTYLIFKSIFSDFVLLVKNGSKL